MKSFIVLALIAAVFAANIWAAPQDAAAVEITDSENTANEDGSYKWSFTLSDGTTREEEAVVVNAGTENQTLQVTGSVSYPAPDGQTISLTYTAGTDGFVPKGDHLPKEGAAEE